MNKEVPTQTIKIYLKIYDLYRVLIIDSHLQLVQYIINVSYVGNESVLLILSF